MFYYPDPFAYLGPFFGIMVGVVVVGLIVQVSLGVWVYNDAKSRNLNALLWLLATMIGGCIGCIVYLILRDDEKTGNSNFQGDFIDGFSSKPYKPNGVKFCPKCGASVENRAIFCSQCGDKII